MKYKELVEVFKDIQTYIPEQSEALFELIKSPESPIELVFQIYV